MNVRFRHYEMYNTDYTIGELFNEDGYITKSCEVRDSISRSRDIADIRDALLGQNRANLPVRVYNYTKPSNPHNA